MKRGTGLNTAVSPAWGVLAVLAGLLALGFVLLVLSSARRDLDDALEGGRPPADSRREGGR